MSLVRSSASPLAFVLLALSATPSLADEQPAEPLPALAFEDGAPVLQSPNGDVRVKLGLRLQVDFRHPVMGSSEAQGGVSPVARRTQLQLRTTLFKRIDSDLVVDFRGGGETRIEHALLNFRARKELQLQVGLGKVPMGHEFFVVSSTSLDFIERSLLFTNINPQYELGAALHGTLWDDRVEYWAGYVSQQDSGPGSAREAHDAVARLSLAPVEGIQLAASGSWGHRHSEQVLRWRLATGFEPLASAAELRGPRQRLGGELTAYHGPFSFKAEYGLRRDSRAEEQGLARTHGLYASASWVLTGEQKSLKGVEPSVPVGSADDRLVPGAWELAARYGRLWGDAGLGEAGVRPRVQEISLALNWYPAAHVRWMLDLNRYHFAGTATPLTGKASLIEVLTRVQLAF